MSKLSLTFPTVGQKDSTEEPKVTTALQAVESFLNGQKIESTDNIKPGGIEEASLSAAVQTLLNTKSAAALTIALKNEAAFTAASGELVVMEKEGSTLTLPEPTANRIVAVFCAPNAIKVKCTKAATKIYGDFVEGVTEVTLTLHQHLLLQASGTYWTILAGEPKREQEYSGFTGVTKAAAEAGVEPSATRPAIVTVGPVGGWSGAINLSVGSKVAGYLREPNQIGTTIFVPPGVKWKTTQAVEASTILL